MNVFNSLGSNYNLQFVFKALSTKNDSNHSAKLKSYLENKYQGKAILVYKGREALELALRLLNLPPGSQVAVNGLTCYAVYQGIINAGHEPEYIDIDGSALNFSPGELKAKLKENPTIKVLLVQNTLGYPCDIEKVAKICKENEIILIEDLAHSVGTIYENNQEAGTVGDFVILSFSQDKMIDGVSGGALIIRNQKYQNIKSIKLAELPYKQQFIDRLYPLFTHIIRTTYRIKVGKVAHAVLKEVSLLSQPMSNQKLQLMYRLPGWYCRLIHAQFIDLQNNLSQRRHIVQVYVKNINPKILSKTLVGNVSRSTNLRFPIFVPNRSELVKFLKKYKVYVSDIWYDAPVAPQGYTSLTNYRHQCPVSERVSSQILNLPTHRNITAKEARKISERINEWLRLQ
jgi:dTDP-4-amino-4,6-dideoxygalactose transaminase